MTSNFRAGFFATVLLFSTALSVPGFAEEAQLLPDLSAEDIARDVKREYNNRTGVAEYIAPTFDPFEQDATMAGSVNLRSVNGNALSIDGENLTNGAILDVAFYYSSSNDDPYDRRGFDDIAFLSGSIAPAVRRDNRILECSRDVQDIVYNDRFYYAPFLSVGLYRPYRHYGGYRRYGRFDRPYWRNRGYGRNSRGYNNGRNRGYRDGWSRRDRDRVGNEGRRRGNATRTRDRNRDDRGRNRDRNRDRNGTVDSRRDNRRAAPYVRSDRRGNMRGSADSRTPRAANVERNRNRQDTRRTVTRNEDARRAERRANRNARRAEGQTRRANRVRSNERVGTDRVRREDRVRNNNRRNENLGNTNQRRNERRSQNRDRNRDTARSTPRPQRELRRENRARPRPEARPTPRREARPSTPRPANPPKRVKNRRTLDTIKTSRNPNTLKDAKLHFFPRRNNYGRSVVRTVNVDCAREETISVFIPSGRLDAARYDGLTVLALDSRGEEYPIFIPPNYIEGFQSAVSGSYNISTGQVIPAPRLLYGGAHGNRSTTQIEAQCPSGTYKQADGTCMIVSGSYP